MKNILLFSILIIPFLINTKFGIGTDIPIADVVFDVNSSNKRLRLSKSNNTSVVKNSSIRLMNYNNEATKASAVYDGTTWKSMMKMMPPIVETDSLTYTFLSNEGNVFENNIALPLLAFSSIVSVSSIVYNSYININKPSDRNTIGFVGTYNQSGMANCVIEIKVFKKRDTQPYFSYKLTNITMSSYSFGAMTSGIDQSEFIEIKAEIFGLKDNITGFSIAYNNKTALIVPY